MKTSLICVAVLACQCPSARSQTPAPPSGSEIKQVSLKCVGGRSLRDTLQFVSHYLQCTVTYEDPHRISPDSAGAQFPGGPVVPRSEFIDFELRGNELSEPDLVVGRLVSQYNQRQSSARFKLVRAGSVWNVIPVEDRAAGGAYIADAPLLDTPITLRCNTTYIGAVSQVCSLLSQATSTSVGQAQSPWASFEQDTLNIDLHGVAARDVLNLIVTTFNKQHKEQISWSMALEPSGKYAALWFNLVPPLPNLAGNITSMQIEGDRPVSEAIGLLANQAPVPIIYEDPEWNCECEVIRNANGKPIALRGAVMEYTFTDEKSYSQTMDDLVKAYNHDNGKDHFMVITSAKYMLIAPDALSDGGKAANGHPLLMAEVSVPAAKSSVVTQLRSLCSELSAISHRAVKLGAVPRSWGTIKGISYGKKTSACELLAMLSKQIGGASVWRLEFDPATATYSLSGQSRPSD